MEGSGTSEQRCGGLRNFGGRRHPIRLACGNAGRGDAIESSMTPRERALSDSTRNRTHRRRILFSLLTVAFGTVLVAAPAFANPPGPGTGNLDPFQPIGAVPDCPAGTINLNNPTTDAADVSATCVPVGSDLTQSVTVNWLSDTVSGNQTDDAWGQGDKSDCFLAKQGGVNGACV